MGWPPIFFLLRKAEFAPRLREVILARSDVEALLNFVHPETGETCLILCGLFGGPSILVDILNKVEIRSDTINSVSSLNTKSHSCSTCLANFFVTGCRAGFLQILERPDLSMEVLRATHAYLRQYETKNQSQLSRLSVKRTALLFFKERLEEKIEEQQRILLHG